MVFQKKIRILKQMHKNLCKNRKKNRLIVKKIFLFGKEASL
jgi:hypothetical protein